MLELIIPEQWLVIAGFTGLLVENQQNKGEVSHAQ